MSINLSIKLLPASVNPLDPPQASDASTSLVPLTQTPINPRASQISSVPPADTFTWSSSTRRNAPTLISATLVEDFPSNEKERSAWEYVSGWVWSNLAGNTAIAHYLSNAASPGSWSGQLLDLYA
jgi:hypothetical protein